jgi:hypothetical protein
MATMFKGIVRWILCGIRDRYFNRALRANEGDKPRLYNKYAKWADIARPWLDL